MREPLEYENPRARRQRGWFAGASEGMDWVIVLVATGVLVFGAVAFGIAGYRLLSG